MFFKNTRNKEIHLVDMFSLFTPRSVRYWGTIIRKLSVEDALKKEDKMRDAVWQKLILIIQFTRVTEICQTFS